MREVASTRESQFYPISVYAQGSVGTLFEKAGSESVQKVMKMLRIHCFPQICWLVKSIALDEPHHDLSCLIGREWEKDMKEEPAEEGLASL